MGGERKPDLAVLDDLIQEERLRDSYVASQDSHLARKELETTVFYFGCIREVGHYVHDVWGHRRYSDVDHPWCGALDAKLTPQEKRQVEGLAVLHHSGDWTAIGFWDRTVDKRSGANSAFLINRKDLSFEQAVELSRRAFPNVWARFPFEVRQQ